MTTNSDNEQAKFQSLENRFEKLKAKRITAEANRRTAKEHLDELKEKARKEYGTDDLGELKIKLENMKTENARLLNEYESHLDEVESSLKKVEDDYGQVESE